MQEFIKFAEKRIIKILSLILLVLIFPIIIQSDIEQPIKSMYICAVYVAIGSLLLNLNGEWSQNSKKTNNRLIDSLIIFALIILFLSPAIVYFIFLMLTYYFDGVLVTVTNQETWIGFAGALIGGSLTMIAVAFTISNENKQRRNEIAIHSIPNIKVNIKDVCRVMYKDKKTILRHHIYIKNESDNIAQNLKVNVFKAYTEDFASDGKIVKTFLNEGNDVSTNFSNSDIKNIVFMKDDSIQIPFQIELPQDFEQQDKNIKIDLTLEFSDVLDVFRYNLITVISLGIVTQSGMNSAFKENNMLDLEPTVITFLLKNKEHSAAF